MDSIADKKLCLGSQIVVQCEGDRHIDDHHTAEDVAITLGQCLHEALGAWDNMITIYERSYLSQTPSSCLVRSPAHMSLVINNTGEKRGLTRMGCAEGWNNGASVRAVLDLSNRPHFESDLPLDEENVGAVEYSPLPSGAADSVGGVGDGGSGDGEAETAAALEAGRAGVATAAPWDGLCGNILSCEMLHHVFLSLTLEMRSSCHLELRRDENAEVAGHTLALALAVCFVTNFVAVGA